MLKEIGSVSMQSHLFVDALASQREGNHNPLVTIKKFPDTVSSKSYIS
jgi:hypothetical protein